MNSKEGLLDLMARVNDMAGSILENILVGPFFVQFDFYGNLRFSIRINICFEFSCNGEISNKYDPLEELGDLSCSVRSADFIFLRGKTCRSASINEKAFEIVFSGSQILKVDLSGRNFEAIEISGGSGERFETLEFYFAV